MVRDGSGNLLGHFSGFWHRLKNRTNLVGRLLATEGTTVVLVRHSLVAIGTGRHMPTGEEEDSSHVGQTVFAFRHCAQFPEQFHKRRC
jgi:hypothetical protein